MQTFENNQIGGLFFAVVGGLFALVGLGMLLVQAVNGPFDFETTVDGQEVTKPLGVPFAFTLFSMGLLFAFLGVGQTASRPRVHTVWMHLAGGNGLAAACSIALLIVCSVTDFHPGWWLVPTWAVCLLLLGARAPRSPAYRHAHDIAALGPAESTSAATTTATQPAQPSSEQQRQLQAATPSQWLKNADGGTLKRAALVGGLGGALLPVLFFGSFFLLVREGNGEHLLLFAVFVGAAAVVFSGFAAGAAVVFVVMRQGFGSLSAHNRDVYARFAERVGGRLIADERRVLGFVSSMPREIEFRRNGRGAAIRIRVEQHGETNTTYTKFTQALPRPAPFSLALSEEHLFSGLVKTFGGQDVQLGWDLFDDHFVVRSDNPRQSAFAIDRELQEQLLQFRHWCRESPDPLRLGGAMTLKLEDDRFELEIVGFLGTIEQLAAFLERAGTVCDRLLENLRLT